MPAASAWFDAAIRCDADASAGDNSACCAAVRGTGLACSAPTPKLPEEVVEDVAVDFDCPPSRPWKAESSPCNGFCTSCCDGAKEDAEEVAEGVKLAACCACKGLVWGGDLGAAVTA